MEYPNEKFTYTYPIIKCRLDRMKYMTREEAMSRCTEIHGTTFSSLKETARYWVFYAH